MSKSSVFYEIVVTKTNLVFMFSILLSAPKHRSHVHVQKNTWLN